MTFFYYWFGDYDQALACFKTIKVLKNQLFYLAATYAKKGSAELAKEKLKEARAVNNQNIDDFIDSQPYTKVELAKDLRENLESIPN